MQWSALELGKNNPITSTKVSGSFDLKNTIKYLMFTATDSFCGLNWVMKSEKLLSQVCANAFVSLVYIVVSKHTCQQIKCLCREMTHHIPEGLICVFKFCT